MSDLPEDGVDPPTEEEEANEPETEFMSPEEAAADDTIDDQEVLDE
jgi:hypothetical protein